MKGARAQLLTGCNKRTGIVAEYYFLATKKGYVLSKLHLADTIELIIKEENLTMNRKRISRVATIAALTATAMPLLSTFAKPKEVKAATTAQPVNNQADFIAQAARQAQKASKTYGLYPSVMIAQAILESGWGQSTLATEANNLFGIKAGTDWTGPIYTVKTREEDASGKSYYINAAFRVYDSYEGSFDDNGQKLRLGVSWQPMRYQGAWLENAATYADATKALTGTYATDHNYDSSLNLRITQYNLTQYDPKISNETKTYTVGENAATYAWPTDHVISTKSGSVAKGEQVTVDKTITYYNGSKRMHIAGKGWVNSTVFAKTSIISQAPKVETKVSKMLMHNAYVYDSNHKRAKGIKMLREDTAINTYGTKTIKGKKYYIIGENQYVAAGNIDGTTRMLSHNSYVYNGSGNRDNETVYKKGGMLATYGSAITIVGQKYYKIGLNQYVKANNFVK